MKLFICCVNLLYSLQVVFATGLVGITNFEMYWPHPCSYACNTIYSNLYLSCSKKNNQLLIETSDACRSANKAYLSSLAWCWETKCENYTISTSILQKAWIKQIANVTISYQDALALGKPLEVLSEDSTWLNISMLPSDYIYYQNFETINDFLMSEIWHARFGLILILIPWILVFIGMIYNIANKYNLGYFLPLHLRIWTRKHILLSALFKEKCNVPVSVASNFQIGFLPPRIVIITIIIYYAINIIFCSVDFRTFSGNIYWPNKSEQLYAYIANRTGVISFVNFPILVLFASRNNLFQWLTGWSYGTFQFFHRHVSFIAVIETMIHSILYTVSYIQKPNNAQIYYAEASKPYFFWGIIATTAICLIIPFSILKLRMSRYEFFLIIHYVLAIITFVACKYHISYRYNTEWGYNYWLYTVYSVWGFDILLRIIKIIKSVYIGVSTRARIELYEHESKTFKLTYQTKTPQIYKNPNNYYYLYFPTIFPFLTSHPFTLSSWKFEEIHKGKLTKNLNLFKDDCFEITEKEENWPYELTFHVKSMQGITKKLYEILEKNNFESVNIPSFIEGSYRESGNKIFSEYDVILVLTAGIGKTVGLNYIYYCVQNFSLFPLTHIPKMFVFNTNKISSNLEHFKEEFLMLKNKYPKPLQNTFLDLHDSSSGIRINISHYIKEKIDELKQEHYNCFIRVGIVSCGPPKFQDESRRCIADLQSELRNGILIDNISTSFFW